MITRWDPFREMLTMRRAMDRLMENSIKDQDEVPQADWSLALDVVENDDSYLVKASVPGVKVEDIEVTYNKNLLTIRGEIKEEAEREQGQYHLRERRYGTFTRTISLPSAIKSDAIHADYKDGVLTLQLPKMEEVKPKRIQINAN
jgi:HSP20 family protein